MTGAVFTPPTDWDRYTIKAEIHRRGLTMTGIARAAGLHDSACRKALFGMDRKGADAIAAALSIPFDTLFPTGFVQSRSNRDKSNAKARVESRLKRGSSTAKTRAQA